MVEDAAMVAASPVGEGDVCDPARGSVSPENPGGSACADAAATPAQQAWSRFVAVADAADSAALTAVLAQASTRRRITVLTPESLAPLMTTDKQDAPAAASDPAAAQPDQEDQVIALASALKTKLHQDQVDGLAARAAALEAQATRDATAAAADGAADAHPGSGDAEDTSGKAGRRPDSRASGGKEASGAPMAGKGGKDGSASGAQAGKKGRGSKAGAKEEKAGKSGKSAAGKEEKGARGGKRGKKTRDEDASVIDDAPADGPDAYYILSGFPLSASMITALEAQDVPLDACVYLATPSSTGDAGDDAARAASPDAADAATEDTAPAAINTAGKKQPRGAKAVASSTVALATTQAAAAPVAETQRLTADALQGSFAELYRQSRAAQIDAPLRNAEWIILPIGEAKQVFGDLLQAIYSTVQLQAQYRSWVAQNHLIRVPARHVTSVDLRHYTRLADSVPNGLCSIAVIMHCMLEQIVRSEHGAQGADAAAADEERAALSTFFSSVRSGLPVASNAGVVSSQADDAGETESAATASPHHVVYGDEVGVSAALWQAYPGAGAGTVLDVDAVERHMLALMPCPGIQRAGMPKQPEKSQHERLASIAEQSHFAGMEPSRLVRCLQLSEFEALLPDQLLGTTDRVYWEPLPAAVFKQRFLALTQLQGHQTAASYFADSDQLLVTAHHVIPAGRITTDEWVGSVPAIYDLSEWCSKMNGLTSLSPRGLVYDIDADRGSVPNEARTRVFPYNGAVVTTVRKPGVLHTVVSLGSDAISLRRVASSTRVCWTSADRSVVATSDDLHVTHTLPSSLLVKHDDAGCVLQTYVAARGARCSTGGEDDDELSRTITSTGSVVRHLAGGHMQVLHANANVVEYDATTREWHITNNAGLRMGRRANDDGVGAEDDADPATVSSFGLTSVHVAKVSDPASGRRGIAREDMVTVTEDPAARVTIVRHADGTAMIRSHDNGQILVSHPNYVSVSVSKQEVTSDLGKYGRISTDLETSVISCARPDGFSLTSDPAARRVVVIDNTGSARITLCCDTASVRVLDPTRRIEAYVNEHGVADVDADTASDDGNDAASGHNDHATIRLTCVAELGDEDGDAQDQDNTSDADDNALDPSMTHPPHLFVVADGGNAYEILPQRSVDSFISAVSSSSSSHVSKEAGAGGVTVVQDVHLSSSAASECPSSSHLQEVTATHLARALITVEKETALQARSRNLNLACVRRLEHHPALSLQQQDAMFDALARYDEWLARYEGNDDTGLDAEADTAVQQHDANQDADISADIKARLQRLLEDAAAPASQTPFPSAPVSAPHVPGSRHQAPERTAAAESPKSPAQAWASSSTPTSTTRSGSERPSSRRTASSKASTFTGATDPLRHRSYWATKLPATRVPSRTMQHAASVVQTPPPPVIMVEDPAAMAADCALHPASPDSTTSLPPVDPEQACDEDQVVAEAKAEMEASGKGKSMQRSAHAPGRMPVLASAASKIEPASWNSFRSTGQVGTVDLAATASRASAPRSSPASGILVTPQRLRCGKLAGGGTYRACVTVTNIGVSATRVRVSTPSGSPLRASFAPGPIAAGMSKKVTVEFDVPSGLATTTDMTSSFSVTSINGSATVPVFATLVPGTGSGRDTGLGKHVWRVERTDTSTGKKQAGLHAMAPLNLESEAANGATSSA